MQFLECLCGFILVVLTLYDIFQSVVVPRWTGRALRFSPFFVDSFWPRYRSFAFRLPASKREDFLGTFAPLSLMLLMLVWLLSLILGYGLFFHALHAQTSAPKMGFGTSLFEAGVSILTIGYGDVVPTGGVMRVIALLAGASGLAIFALVISLTFSLYSLFQKRETFVLLLDARAGSPPSGVTLLETYAKFEMPDELRGLFAQGEVWAAQMLESHLSYPILPHFRSSHDGESWIAAMGAMLDAATLILTTTGDCSVRTRGAAWLFYHLGCHATLDLAHWFRFNVPRASQPGEPTPQWAAGVTRAEWLGARQRLQNAGFTVRGADETAESDVEADAAWNDFLDKRSLYAPALNALARYFATPPAPWIGDRSDLSAVFHRSEA